MLRDSVKFTPSCCVSGAVTSPYTPAPAVVTEDGKPTGGCKTKLAWDHDSTTGHSYANVSARTRQRDAKAMMAAISNALGTCAGPDRVWAAVMACLPTLRQSLGKEEQDRVEDILNPELRKYIDNVKNAFALLNKSNSNEARAVKIALAAGILDNHCSKAKATQLLGVSKRIINQAIKQRKEFFAAPTPHLAAKALMPKQRSDHRTWAADSCLFSRHVYIFFVSVTNDNRTNDSISHN